MLADSIAIAVDDPLRPDVTELLGQHLADMMATSPVESVHALEPDALAASSITFFTARAGGQLLGCVALSELEPPIDREGHGELKSMRTAPAARGQGVATLLLERVLTEARARGYQLLSLETGTQDYFAPARSLYAKFGFTECPPFANYRLDPNSIYLRLRL